MTKPTDSRSYEQQQRKEIQATATTTKATNTQLRTTDKRQRIPKGMRNHTKTVTKGAQTTDNGTEGTTEKMSNGTQAQTQPPRTT